MAQRPIRLPCRRHASGARSARQRIPAQSELFAFLQFSGKVTANTITKLAADGLADGRQTLVQLRRSVFWGMAKPRYGRFALVPVQCEGPFWQQTGRSRPARQHNGNVAKPSRKLQVRKPLRLPTIQNHRRRHGRGWAFPFTSMIDVGKRRA